MFGFYHHVSRLATPQHKFAEHGQDGSEAEYRYPVGSDLRWIALRYYARHTLQEGIVCLFGGPRQ